MDKFSMDQRRFLIFFSLSMLIWVTWIHFLVPKLFPVVPNREIVRNDGPVDALFPANVSTAADDEDGNAKHVLEIPKHPAKTAWIGPTKEETDPRKLAEFFLAAKLQSRGASIETIQLTDVKRYPTFNNRSERLNLVGGSTTGRRTFDLRIPAIDALLDDQPLDRISWEVTEETAEAVTFRMLSPDGVWEISKQFKLRRLTEEEQKLPLVRDNLVDGYEVRLKITLKNLSDSKKEISYLLQGPVGVPLEDKENTYKYRDIRMGFLRDDGVTIDDGKMAATEVVKKEKAKTPVIWKRPLKFIGIDVAYFAAMVLPGTGKLRPDIDSAYAVVASEAKDGAQYSDVSIEIASKKMAIDAHEKVQHEYFLYAGPKQKHLLQQLGAGALMDYGWFDTICRGMIWILNAFHSAGLSYGLAIICLTILVRSLLIPISKHQAVHAAKMKELAPKIQARQKELEARHGKNTEEYMKASQELVAEQSRMMLGGCLPMFLQLPIFIALYRSLGSSIELRMEPFLWFENLASPDAMFQLPFAVPFLGWTEFNLLPCISIALMYGQQKLTMPPPQNEEQAAQYKMMNVMMIVMGATFYRVPAGLCLYFIMTNIWSMTERMIFERMNARAKLNPPPEPEPSPAVPKKPVEPPKPSWLQDLWRQLQEAADKDTSLHRTDKNGDNLPNDGSDGKNGSDRRNGPGGKGSKKRGKR